MTSVAIAGLWTVSAYQVHPLVLPGLVLAGGAVAVTLRQPAYGIALVLALFPLKNLVIGGQQPLRLVLALATCGIVAYALLIYRPHERGGISTLNAAIVLFVAVAIASTAQALDPVKGLAGLAGVLTAGALYLAVVHACRTSAQLLTVAAGAVVGLLVAAAQGVLEHYRDGYADFTFVSGGAVVQRVDGLFGHPNQFAGFLAVLLPLALSLAWSAKMPARIRWLGGAAAALGLLAMTWSYTRGAFLGLGLGCLVWLALVRPRVAAVAAVLATMAAIALAPAALLERFQSGETSEVQLRADLWGSALDVYAERPILGVGLNNFALGYERLPSTTAIASQRRLLHEREVVVPPHANNLYLTVLAEQGLIGIVGLGFLAIVALATAYAGANVRDPVGRSVCIGVGAGLLTLTFHSFLEATLFQTGLLQPLFALVAVTAVYVVRDRHELAHPVGLGALHRPVRA